VLCGLFLPMGIDRRALLKSLSSEAHELALDSSATNETLTNWRGRVETALTTLFGRSSAELDAFSSIRYEPDLNWVERVLTLQRFINVAGLQK